MSDTEVLNGLNGKYTDCTEKSDVCKSDGKENNLNKSTIPSCKSFHSIY